MRVALPLLLAASLLAGCGGDGDDEPKDDRGAIRAVVATFYANGEGVCDVLTGELIENEFDTKDDCEEEASEAAPQKDFAIRRIDIGIDRADVDVEVAEQKGTLLLVKRDGDWKIDGVR